MNANFKYWHDVVADMPVQDENNCWYDMETGIAYDPNEKYNQQTRTRKSVSINTKNSRKIAKMLGGKALIGSIKQKTWAEKLRENILLKCNDIDAKKCLASNPIFEHAAFWIGTRNLLPDEIHKLPYFVNKLIDESNNLLHQAEAQIKTDKNSIIIEKGNYDELMKKREEILNVLFDIKLGKF